VIVAVLPKLRSAMIGYANCLAVARVSHPTPLPLSANSAGRSTQGEERKREQEIEQTRVSRKKENGQYEEVGEGTPFRGT